MGLREINATRTKAMVVAVAMELISRNGYDGTTMEEIAREAGVSSSTLYRYFPTKESVIVGVLGDPAMMAEDLRARSADEAVEIALGHALLSFLAHASQDREQANRFGDLLRDHPRPRARLTEWFGEAHASLVWALLERLEGPTAEVQAGAMAWTAIFVLQKATERGRSSDDDRDPVAVAQEVMEQLAAEPLRTPRV